MNKHKFLQVFATTGSRKEAQKVSQILVTKKLAACVQIAGPIESTYFWQSKLAKSKEWLLIIKTEGGNYKKIESEIKENHSYEVPEIIAVPIINGNKEYLKWLNKPYE